MSLNSLLALIRASSIIRIGFRISLLVLFCETAFAQEAVSPIILRTPSAATQLTVAEHDYAQPGRYAVGIAFITLNAERTPLYTNLLVPLPKTPEENRAPAFPLLLFSPGLATNPKHYFFLLKHLASHGFVILTAIPRNETPNDFWAGAATRPIDAKTLLDYADRLNQAPGELHAKIDMNKIAILGHSSGGWLAMQQGGALLDLSFCKAHPEWLKQLPLSNCHQFMAHEQAIAANFEDTARPLHWPQVQDPRIKAIVALAPDCDLWGSDYQGVRQIEKPILLMTGTQDQLNSPKLCAYPIFKRLVPAEKILVSFDQADHFLFTGGGNAKQLEALKHLLTAFLLVHLQDEASARQAFMKKSKPPIYSIQSSL